MKINPEHEHQILKTTVLIRKCVEVRADVDLAAQIREIYRIGYYTGKADGIRCIADSIVTGDLMDDGAETTAH